MANYEVVLHKFSVTARVCCGMRGCHEAKYWQTDGVGYQVVGLLTGLPLRSTPIFGGVDCSVC